MNQFFLNIEIPKSSIQLQHGDDIVLIGSCFSEEISKKLKQTGHAVYSNPFGTIFHPSVLANITMKAVDLLNDFNVFERDNRFYSWEASTLFSAETISELENQLTQINATYHQKIKSAKLLIVTLGTAWGYELNTTNQIVANCHKMPQNLFTKFLSSPYEIVQDWSIAIEQIKKINPQIQIVFTVSPVRHIKDGIIENNFSKSRLIEAVHQLCMEENCNYFPSYELMIDILRDYRFYKKDKIHPSEEAIDFIWEKFQTCFFDDNTQQINQLVQKVNKMEEHIPTQNPTLHYQLIESKKMELSEKYPQIVW